jgi:hypothetical protein
MSSKQLLRLLVVLAVVVVLWGAIALASRRSDDGSTELFSKVDTVAIDSIALVAPNDTTVIRRGPKRAGWQVNGHAADSQAVSQMLQALAKPQASADLVARNPSSHARLRVTEDSGRRVQVLGQGRALVDVLAGKQGSEGEGIYLRRVSQPDVYLVRGELSTALARPGDEWRDRTIARVPRDSVARVEISRGKRSYSVSRQQGRWVLGSGVPADSAAVAGLLSNYARLEAAGFADKSQQDSLRFDRRRRTARLFDAGRKPLLSLVFDSIGSGIWARVEQQGARATGEPFRLDSWTADQLTPPDTTLRKR